MLSNRGSNSSAFWVLVHSRRGIQHLIFIFLRVAYLSQTGLKHVTEDYELLILLSLPPEYWDYRPGPPHSVYVDIVDARQASHHLSHVLSLIFCLFG